MSRSIGGFLPHRSPVPSQPQTAFVGSPTAFVGSPTAFVGQSAPPTAEEEDCIERHRPTPIILKLSESATWNECDALCADNGLAMPCLSDYEANYALVDAINDQGDDIAWIGYRQVSNSASPDSGWEYQYGCNSRFKPQWVEGEPNDFPNRNVMPGDEENRENCAVRDRATVGAL